MRVNKYIDVLVLIVFSFFILYPAFFISSNYYGDFIKFIFELENYQKVESYIANKNTELIYKVFKVSMLIVFAWVGYTWYDYFSFCKTKTSLFLKQISNSLFFSTENNIRIFNKLTSLLKTVFLCVFIVQIIGYSYILFQTPSQYDELFSYRYFSSKGIWASLSYYPVPNNHVFYNICSSITLWLPFSDEKLMRLPSIIASLITTFYFFKVCLSSLNKTTSLIIITLLISSYPFTLFSISARGYAFVNLFCVLLLYATIQIATHQATKKHWYLFFSSIFLGLLSMPSFVYVLFPILMYLFFVLVFKKNNLLKFILFTTGAIVLAIIFYLPIYYFNNPDNLLNPNGGATKFYLVDNDAFNKITEHLYSISDYFFSNNFIAIAVIVLFCLSLIVSMKKLKTNANNHLLLISLAMLVSPLIILVIHRVIPFQRTWIYLVFPFLIAIGYLLQVVYLIVAKASNLVATKISFFLFLIIGLSAMQLALFDNKHKLVFGADYELNEIREAELNAKIRNIESIALTQKGYEFYTAESIWDLCYIKDHKRPVHLNTLDSINNQDVLVIDNHEIDKFQNKLAQYHLLKYFNAGYAVYLKN